MFQQVWPLCHIVKDAVKSVIDMDQTISSTVNITYHKNEEPATYDKEASVYLVNYLIRKNHQLARNSVKHCTFGAANFF